MGPDCLVHGCHRRAQLAGLLPVQRGRRRRDNLGDPAAGVPGGSALGSPLCSCRRRYLEACPPYQGQDTLLSVHFSSRGYPDRHLDRRPQALVPRLYHRRRSCCLSPYQGQSVPHQRATIPYLRVWHARPLQGPLSRQQSAANHLASAADTRETSKGPFRGPCSCQLTRVRIPRFRRRTYVQSLLRVPMAAL